MALASPTGLPRRRPACSHNKNFCLENLTARRPRRSIFWEAGGVNRNDPAGHLLSGYLLGSGSQKAAGDGAALIDSLAPDSDDRFRASRRVGRPVCAGRISFRPRASLLRFEITWPCAI